MNNIVVSIPEGTLFALKGSREQAAMELRLAAAMKLYELSRLSSGAAAELAGIPLPLFLSKQGEYGVTVFRLSKEELLNDSQNA